MVFTREYGEKLVRLNTREHKIAADSFAGPPLQR